VHLNESITENRHSDLDTQSNGTTHFALIQLKPIEGGSEKVNKIKKRRKKDGNNSVGVLFRINNC
jgi:hypothetical protein